jgi:UDP-N-acetyl-D-glucosamine/UDP-N-acetyl-D-galactosamine dehydrogenase
MKKKYKIGVVGLGYVGLPLAYEFSKKFVTFGFDKSIKRLKQIVENVDVNNQLSVKELKYNKIKLSNKISELSDVNFYIITVPTPINSFNKPDLKFVKSATNLVAKNLKKGDIVVYESTVYPGLTNEVCVPLLESLSKLKINRDFYCGYSPERINPGDDSKSLTKINKIISASNPKSLKEIYYVYKKIIKANVVKTSSIEVAEAAKVIENTQRDLNIGLINELSQIFSKLNIDTEEVLKAASTKWNFNFFKPGLVGGHCIGVDPYYLTYKSKLVGHEPKIILAGRSVNDDMSKYVSKKILFNLKKLKKITKNILILGCTFKENCPDIRNSKVFDLYNHLKKNNKNNKIDIYDPEADKNEVLLHYNIKLLDKIKKNYYDIIVLAVPHNEFNKKKFKNPKKNFGNKKSYLFDLKFFYKKEQSDFRL